MMLCRSLQKIKACAIFTNGGCTTPSTLPHRLKTPFLWHIRPFKVHRKVVVKDPTKLSQLAKPFIFTVAFSSSCMIGASIWRYESAKQKLGSFRSLFSSGWKRGENNNTDEFALKDKWNKLSDADKVFYSIFSANALVYLATKFTSLHGTVLKYFISFPQPLNPGRTCIPLLLSAFCHLSIPHLFFNMYALYSFTQHVVRLIGKEEFVGLYFASAVTSSFGSLAYRVMSNQAVGSSGASGALFAIVAYAIIKNPDAQLGLIFLPNLSIGGKEALTGLVAFDCLGLLLRWKFVDHAGHLCGVVSGFLWNFLWPIQMPHTLRMWTEK